MEGMKKFKRARMICFQISLFVLSSHIFAQNRLVLDSLRQRINSSKQDSVKVRLLNEYGKVWRNTNTIRADSVFVVAFDLSKKLDFKYGIVHSILNRGKLRMMKGEFEAAKDSFFEPAKKIAIENRNNQLLGILSNLIGDVRTSLGQYNEALVDYNESMKYYESVGNNKALSSLIINIGNLYSYQGNNREALKYYAKAYEQKLKLNDPEGVARALVNMSGMNSLLKNFQQAILDAKAAEEICDANKLYYLIPFVYQNLSNSYVNMGNVDSALYYYDKAISFHRATNNSAALSAALNGKANTYIEAKQYAKALPILDEALKLAVVTRSKENRMNTYNLLGIVYFKMDQLREAYLYMTKYSNLKDSLISEKSTAQITEMQTKYDTEKKDKELIKKEAEIVKQQIEGKQRATERNAFILGFALMLVVVFFIFKAYRQKKKSNEQITAQKKIIDEAYEKLNEKNKEVMDSIYYARRIQRALITSEKYILRNIRELKNK